MISPLLERGAFWLLSSERTMQRKSEVENLWKKKNKFIIFII